MWLVNAALRRPYTVWVGMLLVLLLGVVSYLKTPTDILPSLKVPVVVVFASYRGMPAPDMENSVTAVLERDLALCDRIEHIESRSLLGIGIIQVYFRPEVDPDQAVAQVMRIPSAVVWVLSTARRLSTTSGASRSRPGVVGPSNMPRRFPLQSWSSATFPTMTASPNSRR